MAGTSLLALIDDIASILDDVAVMTKVAAKKTAGVLGDDLALNAKQVEGVHAERELPVVWAVGVGSMKNKLILVPAALAISALAPWAVTPLLMFGGAFLCYEGFEKIAHKMLHSKAEDDVEHEQHRRVLADESVDIVALEKEKIKGAIRTDLILSAEIVAISLGTVATASFTKQLAVLAGISVIMTVGVYGFVAGIVKLDDAGLYLMRKKGSAAWASIQRSIGRIMLLGAPYLMKFLSVAGTVAMFMVGGGILTHGIHKLHELNEKVAHEVSNVPAVGGALQVVVSSAFDAMVGVIAGAIALLLVVAYARIAGKIKGSV